MLPEVNVTRLKAGEQELALQVVATLLEAEGSPGEKPTEKRLAAFLRSEDNYLITAVTGGVPVGFLVAYRFHRVDCDASAVYLYDVLVSAPYRRRGIAAAMVRLLKDLCRGTDVAQIWVGSSVANTAACSLWASVGAHRVAEHYVEFVIPGDTQR